MFSYLCEILLAINFLILSYAVMENKNKLLKICVIIFLILVTVIPILIVSKL